MQEKICLALTMGDPGGIGPEIIVKAAEILRPKIEAQSLALVVLGSEAALQEACAVTGIDRASLPLEMIDVAGADLPYTIGQITSGGGEWAYRAVCEAVRLVESRAASAIVTAPLSKEALHLAGHPFEGHTEILAHLTGQRDAVMMLAHGGMRVSHVTTHCALSEVPQRLTEKRLMRVFDATFEALRCLGIENPRLGVAGLNPHAGEGGVLGGEEMKLIAPVIARYAERGHLIAGPISGDTIFVKLRAGQFDAVIAMYHDQGHIPVKLLGFRIDPETGQWQAMNGVNITLGLPILRTSVDHGTAFDIAGKNLANPESMVEAIDYALTLLQGRQRLNL